MGIIYSVNLAICAVAGCESKSNTSKEQIGYHKRKIKNQGEKREHDTLSEG